MMPEAVMVLPAIEEPMTWWRFANLPEQDPDALAAEAMKLTGQAIDPALFAEAIAADHEVILTRTAEALGLEIGAFMAEMHRGRILWRAPLLGRWVEAQWADGKWIPVAGVHDSPLTMNRKPA